MTFGTKLKGYGKDSTGMIFSEKLILKPLRITTQRKWKKL